MVAYYVDCYEKEELVTNFLHKKNKKKIIQKWLSVFVSLFTQGREEQGEQQEMVQLDSISQQFYHLQLKLKALDGLKRLKK